MIKLNWLSEKKMPMRSRGNFTIVPCTNGVGAWEIYPTHETFDTYSEAEDALEKLEREISLVSIHHDLHRFLEGRK